ncbi:MAG: hypothetical protein Ct9H300mP28_22990 [Pseudomonadota bacterium]|nr:MAG: hypothetical protein Ct9H300mP28_22990 [Pseudomonadota bacterium]
MGGHGVALGGIVVEGGRFDWEKDGKFPTLTEPYDGYHGINFFEEFGPQAFSMRMRSEAMRDFGPGPESAKRVLPDTGLGDPACQNGKTYQKHQAVA